MFALFGFYVIFKIKTFPTSGLKFFLVHMRNEAFQIYDFVSYISEREIKTALQEPATKSFEFMLATEAVLRRDWDRPEEDAAWANL